MATLKETLAALTTLLTDSEEETTDAPEGSADLEAENKQLRERVAELEEEQAEVNAVLQRVVERFEAGDEQTQGDESTDEPAVADGDVDGELADLRTRLAELEAASDGDAGSESEEAEPQRQAPQRRQQQTRQRRAAGPSRNATPNIGGMTLEERADYNDKVLVPEDKRTAAKR